MDKESVNKLASSSVRRTLLIFLVGGLILQYVVFTIEIFCEIVWFDFLHYNPYRSQAQALGLMMRSPIDGLFVLPFSVFPGIVATIIAVVSYRIWGRVPFYSLFVIVPVCSLLLPLFIPSLNEILSIKYLKLRDIPQYLSFVLRELPVWIGCWWWSNRTPRS